MERDITGVVCITKLGGQLLTSALLIWGISTVFLNQGASTGAKLSVTKQLFSSFIESYLFYCLVIIYNHLYHGEKMQNGPYMSSKIWALKT